MAKDLEFKEILQNSPSKRARGMLDQTFESRGGGDGVGTQKSVSVSDARSGRHYSPSDRRKVRLLLFSQDEQLLQSGGERDCFLREIEHLFASIHVVVLRRGPRKHPVSERRGNNIWLRAFSAGSWKRTIEAAVTGIEEELTFADGFHADVIAAEDSFDAGSCARELAEVYGRPLMYMPRGADTDSPEDYTDAPWISRYFMERSFFKGIACVRASTPYSKDRVVSEHRSLTARSESLPMFFEEAKWRVPRPSFDAHVRHSKFKFLVLSDLSLAPETEIQLTLKVYERLLTNHQDIGMILLLNKREDISGLQATATESGVFSQSIFVTSESEFRDYYASADVLLGVGSASLTTNTIFRAVANELPIVGIKDSVLPYLLIHGESALVSCEGDTTALLKQVEAMMDPLVRSQVSKNALTTLRESYGGEYSAYLEAYRASMERCLVGDG